MSTVLGYFPFIGASAPPSDSDLKEFLEVNDLKHGRLLDGNPPTDPKMLAIKLQVRLHSTVSKPPCPFHRLEDFVGVIYITLC